MIVVDIAKTEVIGEARKQWLRDCILSAKTKAIKEVRKERADIAKTKAIGEARKQRLRDCSLFAKTKAIKEVRK